MRSLAFPLSVVLLVGVSTPARAAEPIRRWTFLISSDLDGALASPKCHPSAADRARARDLGNLAASLQTARAQAEGDGRTVVAAIQLGDFPGAGAVGRYLLSTPEGAARLSRFVGRLGFTDAILGDDFFNRAPALRARLLKALPGSGTHFLDATATCSQGPSCSLLAALPPRRMLEVDGLRVAIVGVTSDDVVTAIDPANAKGLSITPLTEALAAQAKEAKAAGAQVVVAAVHLQTDAGLRRMLASGTELGGTALILLNRIGQASELAAALEPVSGPAIAASGWTPTSVVRVDVDLAPSGGGFRVVRLATSRLDAAQPQLALHDEMRALDAEYCRALDRPLPARATKPVGVRAFLSFLLDQMRRHAHAEVAVTNELLLDTSVFPLRGAVSAADVFAAMPYADKLARARIEGGALRKLWLGSKTKAPLLAWAGIGEKKKQVFVNDRPLDDASTYELALPDYLARGGDALLGKRLAYETVKARGRALVLRQLALEALLDPRFGTRALAGGRRLDLAGRLRLSWSYGLALTGSDTYLTNSPGYTDPRIARPKAGAISGEATGRLDADARDQSVRLTALAKYGESWVEHAPPAETDDQAFVEALYRLRLVKRLEANAWWAPLPYAGGTLDTEFTQATGAPYRHEELGATVGVRLLPVRPLELKLGIGVRREVLDPNGRARYGLETGYDLPRFSPAKVHGLPVSIESSLDYFVYDLGGNPQHEGRFRARLLVPLGGPLALQAGLDLLLLKTGGQPYALLADSTLGLTVSFSGAQQRF